MGAAAPAAAAAAAVRARRAARGAILLRAVEGTAVRVPKVLATCDDEAVIGAPFYVMERDRGRSCSTDELPDGPEPATGSATS